MITAQKVAEVCQSLLHEPISVSEKTNNVEDGIVQFDGWHVQVGDKELNIVTERAGGKLRFHPPVSATAKSLRRAIAQYIGN